MVDVTEFAGTVFSGLSSLVIDDVKDAGKAICVRGENPGRGSSLPGVRHGDRPRPPHLRPHHDRRAVT